MNNQLISPLVEAQQNMSAAIYAGTHDPVDSWRCSARIPEAVALSIYQRNLHGGVAQHLQSHFPIAYAYLGEQGFQVICGEYLKASPPDQPIFTLYAAHFPGFVLEHGEQNPHQPIWSVLAPLAQIDFFHHNAFTENQQIDVDDTYYKLWIKARSIVDHDEQTPAGGLYQRLELHPEQWYKAESKRITLSTFWQDDELFFRVV